MTLDRRYARLLTAVAVDLDHVPRPLGDALHATRFEVADRDRRGKPAAAIAFRDP